MLDFRTMSQADILAFAVDHKEEMGAGGVTPSYLATALATGRAVLEVRLNAFALIEQKAGANGTSTPHLWLLFVDQDHRGQGYGRRFVKELLKAYSADNHMTLRCSGARRRAFYGRCGFVVEARDGEERLMTTNRDFYR